MASSFFGTSVRKVVYGVIACVVGWMSGCSDSARPHARLAEGCIINTDCTSPLVCAFQRCHAACVDSRDCEPGQRCVSSDRPFHVCQLESESHCKVNTDCGEGQVCGIDDQCRDGCATRQDCVNGQVCVSATCAEPSELTADGTLPSAPRDAGETFSGRPCSFNSDCASPLICRAGICSPECRTTGDCPSGLACDNSRCVVPLACAAGDAGGDPRAGGPCLYTSQCPAPLACVRGYCSCECLGAKDCAPGFGCVNSRCQPIIGGASAVEIGPRGGTVVSSDGALRMEIPAGALGESIVFAVRAATAWPAGAVGQVYEVEPSGTVFGKPATISLSYAGINLGTAKPSALFVGTAVGSSWEPLGTSVNDAGTKTIASTIMHLSIYGLVLFAGADGVDSGVGGSAGAGNGDAGAAGTLAAGGRGVGGGSNGGASSGTAGAGATAGGGASSGKGGSGAAAVGGATSAGGAAVGGAGNAPSGGFSGRVTSGGFTGSGGFPFSGGFGGSGGVSCAGQCLCQHTPECKTAGIICCYFPQPQSSSCSNVATCSDSGGFELQ
jgi:hypothetical protein